MFGVGIPLPPMTDPDKCNIYHMQICFRYMWFSILSYKSSCSNSLHLERNLFHLSKHCAIASSLFLGKAVFFLFCFLGSAMERKNDKKNICFLLLWSMALPILKRGCFELFLLSTYLCLEYQFIVLPGYIFQHQFNNPNVQWVDLKKRVLFHLLYF